MYFCDTHCVTNYSIFILNYIYRPLQCQLPGSATGLSHARTHAQYIVDEIICMCFQARD
jgi:hypothetical protein